MVHPSMCRSVLTHCHKCSRSDPFALLPITKAKKNYQRQAFPFFFSLVLDGFSVSDVAASSARGRNDDRDAGIERVEVEASRQKVVVTGCVNRSKILKALRRVGLRAEPWAPHNELLSAYATTSLMFNNSYSFF